SGTGIASLYNSIGTPQALAPTIPGGGPTGQVFNSTTDFVLPNGTKATFLFSTLQGTIAGWNGGNAAQTAATVAGASYDGLALANNGSGNFLYAANTGQNRIDVFNSSFVKTSLPGSFTDPNLPSGMVVYNIQNVGGKLYVTYEGNGGGVV